MKISIDKIMKPKESLIKYGAWIAMWIFPSHKEEEGAYIVVYR
jgi:hypothetical protein